MFGEAAVSFLASAVAGELVTSLFGACSGKVTAYFKGDVRRKALTCALEKALKIALDSCPLEQSQFAIFSKIFHKFIKSNLVIAELTQVIDPQPRVQIDLQTLEAEFEAAGYDCLQLGVFDFPAFIALFVRTFYDQAAVDPDLKDGIQTGLLKGLAESLQQAVEYQRQVAWHSRRTAAATEQSLDVLRAIFGQLTHTPNQSPVTIPHQVPPPPDDFTGREVELAELLQAHAAGAHHIIIRGLGGVGKSALAFALAEQLTEAYPDGQIFIDLQGASPQPLTPAEVMRKVIQVWRPTDNLPESTSELAALYQTVLHAKKVLLLLDNARERSQVELLIPPAGCCLLLTSRWRFPLPGHKLCDLGALPLDKAIELIISIEPRLGLPSQSGGENRAGSPAARSDSFGSCEGAAASSPTPAHALAVLCECVPLALRLSAASLVERPSFPLDEYLRRFEQTQYLLNLTGMDTSLQYSVDLLAPALQEKLRYLSVFPAPFDRSAAAAVWDTSEESAQEALDSLLCASLLDWDVQTGYRLHDLVRDFAAALMTSDEDQIASLRHSAHFLEVARQVDILYLQGGPGVLTGLRLFDLNWPHIQAGQLWAVQQPPTNQEAAHLCSAYPHAANYCLTLRLHPEHHIIWLRSALDAARRLDLKTYQGDHLEKLGLALGALDRVDQAISCYQQALAIARQIGDLSSEGNYLGSLGNSYRKQGNLDKAIQCYQQSLAIDRQISDRRGEGANLSRLGLAYLDLGQVKPAIEYLNQALAIARETGDRRGEGTRLGSLGLAYAALGQMHLATEYYQSALAIAREIGDRRGECVRLGGLGDALSDLGQVEQAIDYYHQSLDVSQQAGDSRNEGNILAGLGQAYALLGQMQPAFDYLQQSLSIACRIGNRRGEGHVLGTMGSTYLSLGQVQLAFDLCQQALAIAREIGDRRRESKHLGSLGLAYLELGQHEQAIDHIQQALAIAREIGARRREGHHLGSLGHAFTRLGLVEQAVDHYQQALNLARETSDRRSEADQLGNLAEVLENQGDLPQAVKLAAQALAIHTEIKSPAREKMEQLLSRLHQQMDSATFNAALSASE